MNACADLRLLQGIVARLINAATPLAMATITVTMLATTHTCAADMLTAGGSYQLPLTGMRSAKVRSTVIQKLDFSCGSAAIATLLTYQYGYAVTEQSVFEEMFSQGDQQAIRQHGFSLLDMKKYLAQHGFEADGFEQTLDKLLVAKLPAIVLVNDKGYNHFVVVKGLRDGRVLISDPASGTRAMPRDAFEAIWKTRLLFVVHNQTRRAMFDDPVSWQAAQHAPIGSANGDQLRTIALQRLSPGDF